MSSLVSGRLAGCRVHEDGRVHSPPDRRGSALHGFFRRLRSRVDRAGGQEAEDASVGGWDGGRSRASWRFGRSVRRLAQSFCLAVAAIRHARY